MTTRDEMVRTLVKFCDEQTDCFYCLLEKFSGEDYCDFDKWTDDKLVIAYEHVYKDSKARLDGNHLKNENIKTDDNGPDMVNHPQHYTQGGIECIECIKAAVTNKVGIEAVCVANVIKYLFRYEEKNGVEDIRKAKWYIERLLKELEDRVSRVNPRWLYPS